MRFLEKLYTAGGELSAWLFAATGLLLTWEVVARYVFSAPTIWAAEISQMCLIWATFIAVPRTIARRENIAIEFLHDALPGGLQRAADIFGLIFIAAFCAIVFWYGWDIFLDSFERGRSTGTMMNIPNWWTEIVIPLGFGLSFFACLGGLVTMARGEELPKAGGHHE